jgi:hypothetical protein
MPPSPYLFGFYHTALPDKYSIPASQVDKDKIKEVLGGCNLN